MSTIGNFFNLKLLPHGMGGISTPETWCFDLLTILIKMAISKFLSDKFGEKRVFVGRGVSTLRSLLFLKKETITFNFPPNESPPKFIRLPLSYKPYVLIK